MPEDRWRDRVALREEAGNKTDSGIPSGDLERLSSLNLYPCQEYAKSRAPHVTRTAHTGT